MARRPAPSTAPVQGSEDCEHGTGGTVFATGKQVEVEILQGNPDAVFTSDLFLSINGRRPINFGTNQNVGRVVRLGRIPEGTELVFFISVRDTGEVFFTGPGNRNSDGIAHAIVDCLGEGKANISFEDQRDGGDQSFNDIRFQVRTSPLCNANNRAFSDGVTGFGPCGNSTVGILTPVWGRFGARQALESDAGEKLEIRCDGVPGFVPSYHLYLTRPGDIPHVVGTCPFIGGCNTVSFKHSGDADNNGKPDCFIQTYWKSKDYHNNDNPNPWTRQTEPNPVLDHAISVYDVVGNNLVKEDRRYAYRISPPIACIANSRAEGAFLGTIRVDPPLGPETDAFFASVDQTLQQVPWSGVPMTEDPSSPADLNGDGLVDDNDRQLFDSALGSCEEASNFIPDADFDADGCVTFADEETFLDFFGSAPRLTGLGPTQIWIGLKNSDDVGTRFDLLAEVLKNGVVIGSGQVNSVPGGSSGFNNAILNTINPALLGPVTIETGDTLSLRLSVRVATTGHRSGRARLWFNDAAANSRFSATIDGVPTSSFLRSGFALALTAGPGPKNTIDVLVDRAVGGNQFKVFGTWNKTF